MSIKRNWDELDQSVEDKVEVTTVDEVNLEDPPAGLHLQKASNGIAYWTEESGFSGGVILGIIFGLPFFLMGAFSTIIGFGLHYQLGWEIKTSGSMAAAAIMGLIFLAVGGLIIKFSIDYAFTRKRFSFVNDEFWQDTFIYGHKRKQDRFKVSTIEEFGIRGDTSNQMRRKVNVGNLNVQSFARQLNYEIYLRTDDRVLKIRNLNNEQCHFLRNAFYQILKEKKDVLSG